MFPNQDVSHVVVFQWDFFCAVTVLETAIQSTPIIFSIYENCLYGKAEVRPTEFSYKTKAIYYCLWPNNRLLAVICSILGRPRAKGRRVGKREVTVTGIIRGGLICKKYPRMEEKIFWINILKETEISKDIPGREHLIVWLGILTYSFRSG